MARSATLPPSHRPPAAVISISRARPRTYMPPRIAPMSDPEEPLAVEFVGLTPEEQRRALTGWPGARRFALVERTAS